MIHHINVEELTGAHRGLPIADVRSPGEFHHAHIPAAFNLPLFSNEERAQVGTMYKQQGRQDAILLGFDLTGNKWSSFIREALLQAPAMKLAVHCWRGGMRSGAMAWALDLYGFDVYLLKGGYKKYRTWALRQFDTPLPLRIVGGMTGSGKTKVLHELKRRGEQVIDLEHIAQHQGSAFGSLNKLVQPGQEQFENDLAAAIAALDRNKIVWVEDESAAIGKCFIPRPFWNGMKEAHVYDLQVPYDARVRSLTEEYGSLDRDFLVSCTERIRKRLGFEQAKLAVNAVREGRMEDFVRTVLIYYDKTYCSGLAARAEGQRTIVEPDGVDPGDMAEKLLKIAYDG